MLAKHPVRVNHLVVIVHPLILPHRATIFLINLRDVDRFFKLCGKLPDFFIRQHHIFDTGDQRSYTFEVAFCRVLPLDLLINGRQERRYLFLITHQGKRASVVLPSVILDDLGADAVNRPKFKLLCHIFSEMLCAPCPHIPGCRDRIGNCEDLFRLDLAAKRHIPQTCHQYRRFAGARHCEQQYRPIHLPHRFSLLRVEATHIFFFKCARFHRVLLSACQFVLTDISLQKAPARIFFRGRLSSVFVDIR